MTKSQFVFSFASDWLTIWCEFLKPIKECGKAKPIQSQIRFDTQLKIALHDKANENYCDWEACVQLAENNKLKKKNYITVEAPISRNPQEAESVCNWCRPLNPLTPRSDQHINSPFNFHTLSSRQV